MGGSDRQSKAYKTWRDRVSQLYYLKKFAGKFRNIETVEEGIHGRYVSGKDDV